MDFSWMVREDLAEPGSPQHEYPAHHNSILSNRDETSTSEEGSASASRGASLSPCPHSADPMPTTRLQQTVAARIHSGGSNRGWPWNQVRASRANVSRTGI